MDKTKIGVGHILSMGWNELTARAPLMLGLIGQFSMSPAVPQATSMPDAKINGSMTAKVAKVAKKLCPM